MTNDNSEDILERLRVLLNRQNRGAVIDFSVGVPAGISFQAFNRIAQSEVKLQLTFVSPDRQKPVHLFFCENMDYGAFVGKDKYNFIVLYIGVVPSLYDFFLRLMAVKDFWPDIGETKTSPAESNSTDDFRAWESWAKLPPEIPEDENRKAFAIYFAKQSLEFLVRHELAHILLGHCDYLEEKQRPAVIDDSTNALPEKIDPLVVQALESAADGCAAIMGYEKLRHAPKLFGKFPEPVDQAIRRFHRTEDEAIEHYILVLFLSFRLFDQRAWDEKEILAHRHPPAPFWFWAACIVLLEYLNQNADHEGATKIQRAMQRIWEIGETMFATALKRQPDPNPKEQVMSKASEDHVEAMEKCRSELPEHLFSIGYIRKD
jgi:hypothetical protein